jgi:hypothetical protein
MKRFQTPRNAKFTTRQGQHRRFADTLRKPLASIRVDLGLTWTLDRGFGNLLKGVGNLLAPLCRPLAFEHCRSSSQHII